MFWGNNNSFVGLIDVRKNNFALQEKGNISDMFNGNLHFPLAYNPISRAAFVVGLSKWINLCVSLNVMDNGTSHASENDNAGKRYKCTLSLQHFHSHVSLFMFPYTFIGMIFLYVFIPSALWNWVTFGLHCNCHESRSLLVVPSMNERVKNFFTHLSSPQEAHWYLILWRICF